MCEKNNRDSDKSSRQLNALYRRILLGTHVRTGRKHGGCRISSIETGRQKKHYREIEKLRSRWPSFRGFSHIQGKNLQFTNI